MFDHTRRDHIVDRSSTDNLGVIHWITAADPALHMTGRRRPRWDHDRTADRDLDRAGTAPAAGRALQRPVEGRRPRAAQRQRGVEAGRRRPQRPRAHRAGLRQGGLRLDPAAGPAAAASAGGACTPSASPASTAAAPRTLEPHELDDEYFMLRVRIDGGAADHCAAAGASPTSRHDFARDTADITDRQNIQLHWIRVEDVPEIWRRLEAVGLQTTEACGDAPRVVLGCPVAGIAADELIDPTPPIDEITRASSATPSSRTCRASSRPRSPGTRATTSCTRSTTSRSSASSTPSSASATTCGSAAACPPPRAWPSGSASSSPPSGSPTCGSASSQIFRDYGYRRLRTKARLKFLLAEWGTEKFRQVLRDRVPRPRRCPTALAPAPDRRPATTSACTSRRTAASTSARPRSSAGSAATCSPGSPTSIEAARLRPRALDPAPEARRARRRAGRASTTLVAGLDELGLSAPAEPVPPRHDGLHRHRVLQARDRRDQGHAPPRAIAELEHRLADVTDRSTPRSPCTSTAAPTRAPASRSPTSASRGRSSPTDGEQGPASRCTSAAASPRTTATRPASAAPCAA